jgi:PBP1b-binding outer membrane lipoprotein LpoB
MAQLTLNRLAASIIFVLLISGCSSSAEKNSQVTSGATPSATPIPPDYFFQQSLNIQKLVVQI